MGMLHADTTKKIIEAFYTVYNTLGYGFLEKVYERAMIIELRRMRLECRSQYPIHVFYEEENIGDYFADIFVGQKVMVEIKASKALCEENEYQLVNYFKATEIEVGLLFNFGKRPQFKRKIFTN